MSTKDKRMIIDRGNRSARRSTDVSKQNPGLGVGTDGAETHVVHGRLDSLVQRWSKTFSHNPIPRFTLGIRQRY